MFSNIVTEPTGGEWLHCFEGGFLRAYFEQLQFQLGDDFTRWTFHLLHHNLAVRPLELPTFGKGHVLIWFSDESGGATDYAASKFEHVFKCYSLPEQSRRNVHPFPLFGASAVLQREPLFFEKRDIQVFFSGNLNRQRAELFLRLRFPVLDSFPLLTGGRFSSYTVATLSKCLQAMWSRDYAAFSSFIRFNSGFATGLTREEYADTLARSQICLCPAGFITTETMRHFEAMRLGCVVISETLPPSPYYSGSPIIQLQQWRGVGKLLKTLLPAKDLLASNSSATYEWWLRKCSPSAVAHQTAKILRSSQ